MPVPPVVLELRSYVKSAYHGRYSPRAIAAIDQLLQHPDVFPIWEALAADPDPAQYYSLLDACAHALWQWERMPKVPDKEIARNLSRIAAAATSLADALDKHAAEIEACSIEVTVNQYVARPSLSPGLEVPYFDEFSGPATVQSVLRQYATRLRRHPEHGQPELRPTKPRAVAAERTFLVTTVAHFFLTHGGQPHWDWVARVVSALTNTDLDARHAQLIFAPLEGTEWGQAEGYRPNYYDE